MGGYIGARAGSLSTTTIANVQDVTATDTTPEVTIINNTHEDTDGGREGKVIFKGQQSGGEESTLAEIQGSHDGTADDEKGDLIFKTNDGSDGSSPTERVRIDSNGSIITATLGTNNTHLGEGAAASIASGGNNNTAIGYNAGNAITTGDKNVVVGVSSGLAITTGGNNTAIGYEALKSEDGHGNNTAVGYQSLNVQNAGANAANTALGYQAGVAVTDGHSNTLLGTLSASGLTTGDENTYVGYSAGSTGSKTFTGNTALGFNSLAAGANVGDATTAIGWSTLKNTNANSNGHNTALGYNAGRGNDTGYDNTFIGSGAGVTASTAYSNTFIGKSSGNLTTGHSNTYLGRYDGNQDSVDIRSYNQMIVLSDGAGNVRQIYWSLDGSMYMRQQLRPWANNSYNLGGASNKWAEVFANNSSINTSDENEKQQVASLTNAEITAATAISKLFKTYKWNDAVEAKGDAARTHTGVVAQQVKAAMTDAGLDASKYAFWCSDTWWTKDREVEAVEANEELGIEAKDAYTFMDKWENEEDAPEGATKHTVTGVRYAELLAFVSAATEQRLSSIEARLNALEAE